MVQNMVVLMTGDWRSLALRGLAAIAFGVLALLWPGLTLYTLVLLFGAFALVDGLLILASTLRGVPGTRGRRGVLLFEGIVSLAAGVLTFVWPAITAVALVYVIAAWALMTGIAEIAAAIRLRRVIHNEWLLALFGALSVVLSLVLAMRPGVGAVALTWAVGSYALVAGVVVLALAWRVRSLTTEPRGPALHTPQMD